MSKRHMKVAGEVIILEVSKSSDYGYLFLGFVTDGEWNSLRTKGNTRPLSVLQIRADVRTKYSHMSLKKMTGMLTPLCMYIFLSLMHTTKAVACILYGIVERDGVVARVRNPAVSFELLQEVYKWNREDTTIDDVIEHLRLRTVPSKYTGAIHSWADGITLFTYIDTI